MSDVQTIKSVERIIRRQMESGNAQLNTDQDSVTISRGLASMWNIEKKEGGYIRLKDIFDNLVKPNVTYSVMQTGLKRNLGSHLKMEVKRGPLIHVDDLWKVVQFYESNIAGVFVSILEYCASMMNTPSAARPPLLVEQGPEAEDVVHSEELSRLRTLGYLAKYQECSQVEFENMRKFSLFDASEVELMERDIARLENLSEFDMRDLHVLCYLAKTSYCQGISLLVSKVHVTGYKRESVAVASYIIKALQCQVHKVYSLSDQARRIAGELVFFTCFANYTNWFELLRMVLMDDEPDTFFLSVIYEEHL
jgi:hypothetical protein